MKYNQSRPGFELVSPSPFPISTLLIFWQQFKCRQSFMLDGSGSVMVWAGLEFAMFTSIDRTHTYFV